LIATEISTIFWAALIGIDIIISYRLGSLYRKDKDKRKIMFLVGLLLCSLTYIAAILGIYSSTIATSVYGWSSLPILCAYIFVLSSDIWGKSLLPPFYKIFLAICAATGILFFITLPSIVPQFVLVSGMTFAFLLATLLCFKKFSISTVLMMLSMPAFAICLLALTVDMTELAIFSAFMAKVFLILTFETANKQVGDASSLFALETKLNKAEESFYRLFSMLPDPAVIVDTKGEFLDITDSVTKIIGFSREELIGTNFVTSKFIMGESKKILLGNLAKRAIGLDINPYEVEIIAKDGSQQIYEVNASKIDYKGKASVVVAFRDFTERKKLENALLESERLVTLGRTASMVGHDLRNPLQVMSSTMYLMRKNIEAQCHVLPGECVEKVTRYLGTMNEQVLYMEKIVSDIQFVSHNLPANKVGVDLFGVAKETLRGMVVPENIQVRVESDASLPFTLADPLMMKRVFTNLLLNAVQAMPSGGSLHLFAEVVDDSVLVSITDTGVGIPKSGLENLFKPFYTTKAKGVGLGLAVVKRIVDVHGGRVSFESKVGKGTRVSVSIPILDIPGKVLVKEIPELRSSNL
jgi:PAS domain S-box-containing protein